MKKFKTLYPIKSPKAWKAASKALGCPSGGKSASAVHTFESNWNRLIQEVRKAADVLEGEGVDSKPLQDALKACLDNGDFGEERHKIEATTTYKELLKKLPKGSKK